jgi:hypothetical protein
LDDGEDLDNLVGNIVVNADLTNPETILRPNQAPESLDSASTRPGRVMPEVLLQCITNLCPEMCRQALVLAGCLGREDELVSHSG